MKILRVKHPSHFSFEKCLHFLNRGYAECLYSVDKYKVRRLIRLSSSQLIFLEVASEDNYLLIHIHSDNINPAECDEVQSYVIDWFDLDRDISGFYELLKTQKQTKRFPEIYFGLRLMGIVDLFEALCWCVIGQQINLTFAHKIKTRLVHKYGEKHINGNETFYCFPSPEKLLQADRKELVDMQFSKQKINYIYNISQAFCEGYLNKKDLIGLNKAEQMKKLTAIKGIGPWTANYVCMKSLRDMTCIAYGDTGLSLSLHMHFETVKKPSYDVIDKIFKPYAGWESYLNFYLWKSLS